MRIYKKCPHLVWFCTLLIFHIWTFWDFMQQKRQKMLPGAPKTPQNGLKTSETDSNQGIMGIRAKSDRLQISVTWLEKVEYGILQYQIFKFWKKAGIGPKAIFRAKK